MRTILVSVSYGRRFHSCDIICCNSFLWFQVSCICVCHAHVTFVKRLCPCHVGRVIRMHFDRVIGRVDREREREELRRRDRSRSDDIRRSKDGDRRDYERDRERVRSSRDSERDRRERSRDRDRSDKRRDRDDRHHSKRLLSSAFFFNRLQNDLYCVGCVGRGINNNNDDDTKFIKCHNAIRRLQRRWRNR